MITQILTIPLKGSYPDVHLRSSIRARRLSQVNSSFGWIPFPFFEDKLTLLREKGFGTDSYEQPYN